MPRLAREGVVRHGDAGFGFMNASGIFPAFFATLGLPYPPEENWVMAVEVEPGSSAAAAGITKGDIIVRFNGALVTNARDLDKKTFFDHHPGESAVFTMRRGTQEFERRVVLTEYKPGIKND